MTTESLADPVTTKDPILELRAVSKVYGHVQALNAVDFQVYPNEIVALVGDNGAGKSTLIKIIAGVYQPTSGEVVLRGASRTFNSPADAVEAGISTVYQDLSLVEGRSVAANLFLGREPTKGLFVDKKRIHDEAREAIKRLKADIPSVEVPAYILSGGQRQAVAIGRAVLRGGDVIVMDEPTASLGVTETHRVLNLVAELKAQGKCVVLISHNLQHVWDVADRIVVLHRGFVAGNKWRSETTKEEIVKLIVFGAPDEPDI